MGIKVNRVHMYRGVKDNVVNTFFQVVGFEYPNLGEAARVKTVQEGTDLDRLLTQIKAMKIRWTNEERITIHDVFIARLS